MTQKFIESLGKCNEVRVLLKGSINQVVQSLQWRSHDKLEGKWFVDHWMQHHRSQPRP
jgi:hypothetical protein